MRELFESFKQVSTLDPSVTQFAGMFAQTLAYGLFAARFNHADSSPFQNQYAKSPMPYADPFLQKLAAIITRPDLDNEPFTHYIEKLVHLLAETDLEAVLAGSNPGAHQEDPLTSFYEQFLQQYDPQLRELRGVYYTPEPVVSYMVRSADLLLRSHFNCPDGLAGTSITNGHAPSEYQQPILLLDPACGTGIFLQAVIKYVRAEFQKTGNAHWWSAYVHTHLLPHLFGFELLVAPYVMAHLNLGMQLAALDLPEPKRSAWAYNFQQDERLNIYLANTLEEALKYDNPIMVILGNPPYAGHSANKGQWISTLLDTYKEDCPELKKPGQAKWLSDDYVKFMRFAQWHIEQAGYGIMAFITSHSYLDNPTFRGMRRSLLQSFDDIYILDLHGNSKKQEQAPGGSKDENIFDIQQGVAISIFVKWREISGATIHHADLWGPREVYEPGAQGHPVLTGGKFSWLAEHDLASTQWTILNPQPPFYLFTPQDSRYAAEYEAGWRVPDIFRPNGDPAPGIVTCHDQFAISWTEAEAYCKVERFLSTKTEDEARQLFRLCSQDQWQYASAKSELQRGAWRQETTEILYRPFDRRWTVFNRHVAVHRRERVMRHMLAGENIGLTIGRAGQVIDQDEWDIVFCTRFITEFNLYRRGGNNLFPLYLYDDASSGDRSMNLAPEFISDCIARLGMRWIADGRGNLQQTLGPEDIFAYMYAVFYSPTYRKRYAPFLKIDFPLLPLTSNGDLFRALCTLGDRLVGLHLMEQSIPAISDYSVPGDNRVEAVRYIALAPQSQNREMGSVWINATQYFENVPLEAWNFSIGGYQICKKWLNDRKGRKLRDDDLARYQQIVAILSETSRLMHEIDETIEEYGGWPL
jgi:predicted helicase